MFAYPTSDCRAGAQPQLSVFPPAPRPMAIAASRSASATAAITVLIMAVTAMAPVTRAMAIRAIGGYGFDALLGLEQRLLLSGHRLSMCTTLPAPVSAGPTRSAATGPFVASKHLPPAPRASQSSSRTTGTTSGAIVSGSGATASSASQAVRFARSAAEPAQVDRNQCSRRAERQFAPRGRKRASSPARPVSSASPKFAPSAPLGPTAAAIATRLASNKARSRSRPGGATSSRSM